MRIFTIHTYYQQRGGEDESFAAEVALLHERGHKVLALTFHNQELDGMPPGARGS